MRKFRPGQVVALSGIYRVYHARHRLMHEALLLQGDHFPACTECRDNVRFALSRPVSDKPVSPFRSGRLLELRDKLQRMLARVAPPRIDAEFEQLERALCASLERELSSKEHFYLRLSLQAVPLKESELPTIGEK